MTIKQTYIQIIENILGTLLNELMPILKSARIFPVVNDKKITVSKLGG